ncbi:MAG: hypothetical protein ACXWLX_11405 [Rhizomicrobium sp.]
MAKLTILAAGILLSSALVLTGCGQAAPDCKTSPSDPACAKAVKQIAAAKPSAAANPGIQPMPRPETRIIGHSASPSANKQAVAKKPQHHLVPRRTALLSPPHRTYTQPQRSDRWERQKDWNAYDTRRDRYSRESWPPPAYESAPGPLAGGCGEACQYRAWFERYSAWYERYGRTYNAAPRGDMRDTAQPPSRSDYHHDDRLSLGAGQRPDQSERDRLAPWHGYNPSDGPENGY